MILRQTDRYTNSAVNQRNIYPIWQHTLAFFTKCVPPDGQKLLFNAVLPSTLPGGHTVCSCIYIPKSYRAFEQRIGVRVFRRWSGNFTRMKTRERLSYLANILYERQGLCPSGTTQVLFNSLDVENPLTLRFLPCKLATLSRKNNVSIF